MSVNTVGIIPVKREPDVFKVVSSFENSLRELFKSEIQNWRGMFDQENTTGTACMYSNARSITYHFKYEGKDRQLSVHFDCHNDYKETHKGKKLIISLGCNEQAKKLIPILLKGLKKDLKIERAYFNPCDCDNNCVEI
jgi:hypothetical protein